MISNIMLEEGEEEAAPLPINVQPSVYYKYTDTGAEREDPEALTKKKKKKGDKKGAGRPLTAKKIKNGDIVSMVETMTHGQQVSKVEKEAKKRKAAFPKAKGI
jgi:hypothetical protein